MERGIVLCGSAESDGNGSSYGWSAEKILQESRENLVLHPSGMDRNAAVRFPENIDGCRNRSGCRRLYGLHKWSDQFSVVLSQQIVEPSDGATFFVEYRVGFRDRSISVIRSYHSVPFLESSESQGDACSLEGVGEPLGEDSVQAVDGCPDGGGVEYAVAWRLVSDPQSDAQGGKDQQCSSGSRLGADPGGWALIVWWWVVLCR